MPSTKYLLLLLVAIALVAAFVYRYVPHALPEAVGVVATTTTPGTSLTTASNEANLTQAFVTASLPGSWKSAKPLLALTFRADGTLTSTPGTLAPVEGTWFLYTPLTAPADLAGLVLEPDHVFMRITIAGKSEDYFLWRLDSTTLSMGPIGKEGSVVLTRVK